MHFQNKGFLHWRLYSNEITLGILQIHADFKIYKHGMAKCVMVYRPQKRGHAIKQWCKNSEAYQILYISLGYKRVTADIVILEQNVHE